MRIRQVISGILNIRLLTAADILSLQQPDRKLFLGDTAVAVNRMMSVIRI